MDLGYRGHNYADKRTLIVDQCRHGEMSKRIWLWLNLNSAVEGPV
jgi:hypothetical protein